MNVMKRHHLEDPPPKRRCFQPSTDNTSRDETPLMDSETEEDSMPPQKCDVGTQCPDPVDHNYCSHKSKKDAGTQTDHTPSLSAYDLDDKVSKFYTGLAIDSFWKLLYTIMAFLPLPKISKLAVHDQLLLVLMRLRLGLMFTDLSIRFGISRTTACDIWTMWRPVLANFMRDKVIAWLPRDTLKRIRPQSFIEHYPNATCVIDCTEIFVQRPKNLKKRAQTYSNYKHHNTYRVLYCIAPNGYVMFVSKLFGGRASDTFITKNCGVVGHLIPGDQILADRGFTIKDALPPGVSLAIPAFTRGCKQLSEHEVTRTRCLANVRIHVERAIRRLKCFKILSNVIPGSLKHVDDILSVCAGLCNLQPALIKGTSGDDEDVEMDEFREMHKEEGDEYLWDIGEDQG
ncbi:uncharacterized protein LOC115365569 [Myripristis murdjan]|uniref:Uncharacterized LOC115365569 n=1 Tax=Myripristis murdjan TaxID=586833 RepID=A0A667XAB6_9TELE|nr:uncharacterized protein LOC115365569 [Myripristis murdjan]